MKVKDKLAELSGWLIGSAVAAVGLLIAGVFIFGAAWASAKLLPWFVVLTEVAFGIVVFVLLPLAIPKATRGLSSVGLVVASYLFGAVLWMSSLLLTLAIWGVVAVVIGLFMAGVGVVPIALVATLTNGMWDELLGLVLLAVMTFGCRIGGVLLGERRDG